MLLAISEHYRIGWLTLCDIHKNKESLNDFSQEMTEFRMKKVKTKTYGSYEKLCDAI